MKFVDLLDLSTNKYVLVNINAITHIKPFASIYVVYFACGAKININEYNLKYLQEQLND